MTTTAAKNTLYSFKNSVISKSTEVYQVNKNVKY